jgi:thiol:disulfide interchange protein DsbG
MILAKLILATLACFTCLATQAQGIAHSITEEQYAHVKLMSGIDTQSLQNVRPLFVFFDPNCPHCAKLWDLTVQGKPFHEVPARWIPVTYLSKDSLGKGAAILRRNNKSALTENFTKFNIDLRQGSIAPIEETREENTALGRAKTVWIKLGGGTPLLVYRDKQGVPRRIIGLHPPEVLSFLLDELKGPLLETYKEGR